MTSISLSYPMNSGTTEAHVEGCKAATRGQARVRNGYSVEDIKSMKANPDEGFIKVHACAKKALA